MPVQCIHFQYCGIMRFTVLHKRHHKVSQSVPFFIIAKQLQICQGLGLRGHFVMSITKNHETHYCHSIGQPSCTAPPVELSGQLGTGYCVKYMENSSIIIIYLQTYGLIIDSHNDQLTVGLIAQQVCRGLGLNPHSGVWYCCLMQTSNQNKK